MASFPDNRPASFIGAVSGHNALKFVYLVMAKAFSRPIKALSFPDDIIQEPMFSIDKTDSKLLRVRRFQWISLAI